MRLTSAWLACVVVVAIAGVACRASIAPPDVVVLRWMQAFAAQDGQAIASLTCRAGQTDVQNTRLLTMALGTPPTGFAGGGGGGGGFFGGGGGSPVYDVSNLNYTTAFADGRSARVQVTGFLRITSGMNSQTLPMNSSVPLIMEQDQWRVCDTPPS
jgi:hypothetical protein